MRIGHSMDIHQLGPGNGLIIGGITIPCDYKSIGHSDADALLHSITEAIMGALAIGDIGTLFPDTDEKYKGIDSSILLKKVVNIMKDRGYIISNIDSTVYLEKPKLRPYIESIRANVAKLLEISSNDVSVKATTSEKRGIVGRGEVIACESVLLIDKKMYLRKLR